MYFEDYTIGEIRASRGRTITEADIVNFAGLSGDFVELHMNEEYAKRGPYGRRIAHGALIFSISTGLMVQMTADHDAIVAFRGVDQLRFVAPVFIGDTIRLRTKVLEKEARAHGRRGVITWRRQIFKQDGKIVQEGTTLTLVEGRGGKGDG